MGHESLPRLLLGTDEPVPPVHALGAGPLQVRLRGTRLLAIEAAGHEVWHGAAFLYRDEGWGTPEPVADRTHVEQREGGFTVRIEGHIPARERIALRIEITGTPDGRLTYEAAATPCADLPANRIGVCVLHPPSSFGRRITITHVDGRGSASTLPTTVAPWPPFMGVRALRHEYADGAWARCQLEGDSFELEDQRNNADASFKTYSRSNLMPRPFRLAGGQEIRQRIVFQLEGALPAPLPRPVAALRVDQGLAPLPSLGLGITAADALACDRPEVAQALRQLALPRLHLGLRSPKDEVHWPGIAMLLAAGGSQLRLDIEGLDDPCAPSAAGAHQALQALAGRMARAGVSPAQVAVFPGTPRLVAAARQAFPGAAIGSGTPHFFAQLNRIEGLGAVDFLSFTVSSIVHGADDDAVMHGLQSLPWLVRTVAQDHPGIPLHTGPSAIAAPRSPLGAQPAGDGIHRIALAQRDPRTGAMFGAAWLLGHVAGLAQAGAPAVSVLQLLGDQGILREGTGTGLHRSPAFHVLQALAGATHLRRVDTGGSGEVAALWVTRDSGDSDGADDTLLLANLTAEPVGLQAITAALGRPQRIDPFAVEAESEHPWQDHPLADPGRLDLPPWSVIRIQGATRPPPLAGGSHEETNHAA